MKLTKNKMIGLIAIVIVIIGLALIFYPTDDTTGGSTVDDPGREINITIVVLQRDIVENGGVVFGGPVKTVQKFSLTMPADSSIRELKNMIYKKTNISFSKQRLVHKGVEVDKLSRTLDSYNITDGSRIHVLGEYTTV